MTRENPTRFFNPDEWEKFIYKCNPKVRSHYWIMMLTGMRHNEAKNVRVKDIDFKNKWIVVLKGKGKKIRYPCLSSYASKYLKSFIKENNLSSEDTLGLPTRQAMIKTMKSVLRELGFKDYNDFSTHALRRTHENYLISLDMHQGKITKHMGHTSKTALEHYISGAFIRDKKQIDKMRLWVGDIFDS